MELKEYFESKQFSEEKTMEMENFRDVYVGKYPAGTMLKLSDTMNVVYGNDGSVILRSHHVEPVKIDGVEGYNGASHYQGFRGDGIYFNGYIKHALIMGEQEHFVYGVLIETNGKVQYCNSDYTDTYDREDPITYAYDIAAHDAKNIIDDTKAQGDDE